MAQRAACRTRASGAWRRGWGGVEGGGRKGEIMRHVWEEGDRHAWERGLPAWKGVGGVGAWG